jgi:hypothetical protein
MFSAPIKFAEKLKNLKAFQNELKKALADGELTQQAQSLPAPTILVPFYLLGR